jgi:phosphotransferase system IIB component
LKNNEKNNIILKESDNMLLNINLKILIPVVLALLLIFILVFIFSKKTKKIKKINVSEELVVNIVLALGGKDNIVDIKEVSNRISFEVNDIKNIKFDDLKKLSNGGVFVTNNQVKTLFQTDSKVLKQKIKSYLNK